MDVVRGAGRTATGSGTGKAEGRVQTSAACGGVPRPSAGSLEELGQHRERDHVGSPSLVSVYEHTERSRQLVLLRLATHDPSGLQPVVHTSVRRLRHTVSPHQEP